MTIKSITNQTIALAGISQACVLVDQLASTGTTDQEAMETSLNSLLKVDADTVIEVFGGLDKIKTGLQQLRKQLTGRTIANPEQARYAAGLVFLEKKLASHPDMKDEIRVGIEKAIAQTDSFGSVTHENVIANLGDLYHSTISTFQPRIMVNGKEEYLAQPHIVNKIRSLLLAGIRSTMLWRQCGGTRWKFLLFRAKLQDELDYLLSEIE